MCYCTTIFKVFPPDAVAVSEKWLRCNPPPTQTLGRSRGGHNQPEQARGTTPPSVLTAPDNPLLHKNKIFKSSNLKKKKNSHLPEVC